MGSILCMMIDPGGEGGGVLAPCKYVRGSEYVRPPKNVTFLHSQLLSDNSASFTSSRMKDLRQKKEGKTNFLRHMKQFDGFT